MSAFLVESDRPGFALGPQKRALGLHGFGFGELIFDHCRVPVANRLGEEGDGLSVVYSSSVLYGRPNLTAAPLGELGPVTLKLGQMQSRLMTARLVAYHAVHLLDRGLPHDAELMNAKLVNVDYALDSARDAYHIFAPAGTSDTQRLRLGEVALGKAKSEWSGWLAKLVQLERETAA